MSQKRSSYVKRLFRDFAQPSRTPDSCQSRNRRSSDLNGLVTDPDWTCG